MSPRPIPPADRFSPVWGKTSAGLALVDLDQRRAGAPSGASGRSIQCVARHPFGKPLHDAERLHMLSPLSHRQSGYRSPTKRSPSASQILAQRSTLRSFGAVSMAFHAGIGQSSVKWLRRSDSNRRPPGYEPSELPGCSTPNTWNLVPGRRRRPRCAAYAVPWLISLPCLKPSGTTKERIA